MTSTPSAITSLHPSARVVIAMLIALALTFAQFAGLTALPANANQGQCPDDYENIEYSGSLSWESDGDYASVILVGGPPGDQNQDPDGRDKSFSNVEEGQVIAREAHDISHICVIPSPPDPTASATLAKAWNGDTEGIELDDFDVTLTYTINDGDEQSYDPAEGGAISLEIGDTIAIVAEDVDNFDDLADGCTYTAGTLPATATIPAFDEWDEEQQDANHYTTILTLTNTIDCDDDPPPPPTPTPTPDPGEVTVEKVVLGEDAPEDAEFSFILECGDTTEEFTLADGESSDTFTVAAGTDCTVSETDDQDANLTSWELTGDAVDSGEGTDTDGFTVAANDEITVTFTNEFADVMAEVLEPGISVTKTAVDGVSEDDEGNLTVTIEGEGGSATVTYEFVVTNTGDDDLTDLTLVDDKIGDLTDALTAELEDATLPVGESVTVTADHEVTAADFDGITLTNVVEVVGVGVDSGATVDDSDDETVTLIEVMDVVEEEPEELPKTGLSSAGLTGLGLLLSMIGAAALLLTSPRREEDAS